jgi:hypothetical protein
MGANEAFLGATTCAKALAEKAKTKLLRKMNRVFREMQAERPENRDCEKEQNFMPHQDNEENDSAIS